MKQRIKFKILKRMNIIPLICMYEESILEWKNAFQNFQIQTMYNEMEICKKMMHYDYKMINKLRGRFKYKDIIKYRYKKYNK